MATWSSSGTGEPDAEAGFHARVGHDVDVGRVRLDLFAVTAAVLALTMLVVYLWLMRQESDQPASWFVAGLVVGAGFAGYGARFSSPYRLFSLLLAGASLVAMGVLAIFSIGFPILVAGTLCVASAVRHLAVQTS